MTSIRTLSRDDQILLDVYSAVDHGSGAAFADADCSRLVADWRSIAVAEIARHSRRKLVLCESPDGWSLHEPGSSDDDIASGKAPYITSGPGTPTDEDYAAGWIASVACQHTEQ